MTKTETLNLRVSADFKRRLAQEAAKEKRSVTNYLEATLSKVWEQGEPRRQRRAVTNVSGQSKTGIGQDTLSRD